MWKVHKLWSNFCLLQVRVCKLYLEQQNHRTLDYNCSYSSKQFLTKAFIVEQSQQSLKQIWMSALLLSEKCEWAWWESVFENPVMTFPKKIRISNELFIDRTVPLYIGETRNREEWSSSWHQLIEEKVYIAQKC